MAKFYKYDTHVHDSECSLCGASKPEEMVDAYAKAGYDGFFFTNHFFLGNTAIDRSLPWNEFVLAYWNAFSRAKEYAKERYPEFSVLFGLEHHYAAGKEVLTYGIDLDFLLNHPNLHEYSIKDYCAAVHEAGGYISHAHPFRNRSYIDMSYELDPSNWDAAEAYNHYNHPEENELAEKLAAEFNLQRTSGSDEHCATHEGVGKAGMAFPYPIRTEKEFVAAMRRGDGKCIINGVVEE